VPRVLITGAAGFIGRNLAVRLGELAAYEVVAVTRADFPGRLAGVDAVVHLAGVNRSQDEAEFARGNEGTTEVLCQGLTAAGSRAPIIYASSAKVGDATAYGRSKAAAERLLFQHAERTGAPLHIFRLPNVFGKWCRPEYNSVVATFCHRTITGQPVDIHDAAAPLQLVYIDDVLSALLDLFETPPPHSGYRDVAPVYRTTVGELERLIRGFRDRRQRHAVDGVGSGFARALYATFLSYLPAEQFSYPLVKNEDARGLFAEVLRTENTGQFSVFTAYPGVTRGGHYHHTKTEKFVVVHGEARFRFRNVLTNETCDIPVSGRSPRVVEAVPGWSHDVTNIGSDLLVCWLWASEVFDANRPDTISSKV
jgi:UDP-2-acetamido-2,6-beta-L-arabino-hexul-4-ose reductase